MERFDKCGLALGGSDTTPRNCVRLLFFFKFLLFLDIAEQHLLRGRVCIASND